MNFNLIIDGNYLMMKSVFSLHKNKMLGELYNIIEKDVENIINLYPFKNIFFISDSRRNWRKDIFPNYKIQRKKNININWEYVFDVFDDIKDYMSKYKNSFVYKIDNLEGDDIISYIVNKENNNGYSNFIVGNDSDLFQLIKFSDDFINLMYNDQYKKDILYLPVNYKLFIEKKISINVDEELFGNNSKVDMLDFMKMLLNRFNIVLIDYELQTFMKIMGHNKDSIHSVYMVGDRGIGKMGINKVYELYKILYPEKIDFNSDIFKERLLFVIKKYKKIINNDKDDEILNNINRNIKLTKLDEKNIPEDLYDKMSLIIQ
jgi:hypothetical protein